MKRNHLPLKEFINQLKSMLKGKYNAAVWPIAGITLLYLALTALLALLFTRSAMMLGYATMLIMYGMISQVLLAVVEALGILILWFLVTFGMYFVNMSILYSYQDQIKNPNLKVSATTIWKHFKHLNKNQLLRLTLYSSLFIFLWTLPLDIVAGLVAKNQALVIAVRIANFLITFWKTLEYSQAPLLYRDQQPAFLGQSMRHALTASRRFMGGKKLSFFTVELVVSFLPMLVWGAIFGGLAYYGNYTATYFVMYAGLIIMLLGFCAYAPVVYLATAQFYEQSKPQSPISVEDAFVKTFKPVEVLTGEAYDDAADEPAAVDDREPIVENQK